MNFRRMLLVNILILLVLLGGGIAGYYYYNRSATYLSTDNARIDGQQVAVAAPGSGRLLEWTGALGKHFAAGERIGAVEVMNPAGHPAPVDITVPADSTIVQQTAVRNSLVAAGMPLAYAFDLDHLWVTANIKETDISDVAAGQDVDVYIDAFPGTVLKGKVDRVGLATASTFSLMPSANTTGNYTKVTQVIPVTVALEGYRGLALAPGMNVTARIHK